MKTPSFKFSIFFLLALLGLSSCKKAPYEAEVESNEYTLSNWTEKYNDAWNFRFECDQSIAAISQDIVDDGAVMCYVKDESNNAYIALPYSFGTNQTSSSNGSYGSITMGFVVQKGKIVFAYEGFDDLDVHTSSELNAADIKVKVVVISPDKMASQPNVNLNNYEEVKAAFSIQD
jgi:hypothetical protein